jgi:hypothetical protein
MSELWKYLLSPPPLDLGEYFMLYFVKQLLLFGQFPCLPFIHSLAVLGNLGTIFFHRYYPVF